MPSLKWRDSQRPSGMWNFVAFESLRREPSLREANRHPVHVASARAVQLPDLSESLGALPLSRYARKSASRTSGPVVRSRASFLRSATHVRPED